MSLGTISYSTAALLFLLLTLLLSIGWGGREQGGRFILASGLNLLWALILALEAEYERTPFIVVYLVEMLRSSAWLVVLLGIAGGAIPQLLRTLAYALCFVLPLGALAVGLFGGGGGDWPAVLLASGGLALSLCGLILLEQIYRNAHTGGRKALKPLLFGIGGLFAYDLFLFSQAELFHAFSADSWNARGIVNALLVPVIALAVRRNPQWSLDIFVSRHVLFYTSSFVLIGVYLLLMAAGGYYVRNVGGSWGGMAQIAFFVGAAGVLLALAFSGNMRARARVFLSKHFYRNKYDYRIEWLRFIRTLSASEEDEGEVGRTALRAIAQIFSSPGGILFTVDESGRRFVARAAWPMRLTALPQLEMLRVDHEFAQFLAKRQWIVDFQEYARIPELYQHVEIPEWIRAVPGVRIVSPLLQLDRLVGFVLLYAPPGAFKLTYEDRDLLLTAGRQVSIQIAQQRADRKLAESRQFEAYHRLVAFMMHDLKNSAAQLQLLVANAERHKHNPAFVDDAIETIANTAQRITRLTEQLQGKREEGGLRPVDFAALTRSAVQRCSARAPMPVLDEQQGQTMQTIVSADPDKLGSVIEHVIRNAQDATPAMGSIKLLLTQDASMVRLTVEDTGSGMEAEFLRERLFRPFDSTKGSKGMGIGAYQVREYVRQLGGDVEVQSSPGRGTVFSITIPLAGQALAQPALAADGPIALGP